MVCNHPTRLMIGALICLVSHSPALGYQPAGDPEGKDISTRLLSKTYTTNRTGQLGITIDGFMDDDDWELVEWAGDFIQFMPNEKTLPSQQTRFKVLYDEKFLYVGVRALDDNAGKIVKRVGRRDELDGDWIEVDIDSYNDKRSGFAFKASAAGGKGDEFISNNGQNWDQTWDPIWYLKTSVDNEGWTAEMKIPLSQLRFSNLDEQEWGLQVMRFYFQEEERSIWQYIPRNDPGWVHKFGSLNGLKDIEPQKQLEIMPYVVGKMDRYEGEEGNPFATGKEHSVTVGVDGKIGITNDISLDFTINPDFGQVEADPSQLNLGAFQVFFQERRPFFIEGSNILTFPIANFRNDNLFYSRRIGGRPHGFPTVDENEFVKLPDNTRIWGAAKLTGKNKHGLSFGILESVTAREYAIIDSAGTQSRQIVEPLSNYFVARASQDFNGGTTVLGGMITNISRKLEGDLDFLHKSAWTGGIDLLHQWKDKKYFIAANAVFSNVKGSQESIIRTQEANERFFQRPDNHHKSVDTTLTSLTGSGGQFRFGKQSGKLTYEIGTYFLSPNLELNNQGFLMNTDQIEQWARAQYRINKPFSIFRMMSFRLVQSHSLDFGGKSLNSWINLRANSQFKNFWQYAMGANFRYMNRSNADLRGGPSISYPGQTNFWFWAGTDTRKKVVLEYNNWFVWGGENYRSVIGYWARLRFRPIDVLEMSLNPMISISRNDMQYVTTQSSGADNRYIVGQIDQKTFQMQIRVNWNINPNLSISYWGQPFMTTGAYSNYKNIINSNASDYSDRFHQYTSNEISYDADNEVYMVDENQNGTTDYEFYNPDFNFLQFRSNAVLRWEYKPGSALFVVWSQNRSANPALTAVENSLGGLTEELFTVSPRNTFLIKYTYRFVL